MTKAQAPKTFLTVIGIGQTISYFILINGGIVELRRLHEPSAVVTAL
jgi:hypothetical protein